MKNTDRILILLTGTIDPTPYGNGGALIDKDDRLLQYRNAITRYICETEFTDIVFIDNSGFEFESEEFLKLSEKYNKRFEFLKGSICSKEVKTHGRSYGDALLIHEAIKLSTLLRHVDYFYKVTGRLFLENHKTILKSRNSGNEFVVYPGIGWCFTNFFKVKKEDWLCYFDDVFLECDERSLHDIEICFFNRIIKYGLTVRCFRTYPYFGDARMGGTGKYYSDRIPKRWIRNALSFCQFFSVNAFSEKIFTNIAHLFGKPIYRSK